MKIRGNTVGTPLTPEAVLLKAELTEEQKAEARARIGAAAIGEAGGGGGTGNDGFSPIAKVTQTAEGATIEITDKDGTTTATVTNGKDGVDGKDGQDGTPGNDYVLTEADKEEIAGMVDVGASTLIVTLIDENNASHTSKQIYDHVQNSGNVVLLYDDIYIPLTYVGVGCAVFEYISDDNGHHYFDITNDGTFHDIYSRFANEDVYDLVNDANEDIAKLYNAIADLPGGEVPPTGELVQAVLNALPVYDGSYADMEIYDGLYTKGAV